MAEDYGDLADGLLWLHQASGETRWLTTAGRLLDDALALFAAEDGGFFDAGSDAEQLVRRPRDPSDNATPSGASALINALVDLRRADRVDGTPQRRRSGAAVGAAAGRGPAPVLRLGAGRGGGGARGPVQVADRRRLPATCGPYAWRHRPPGAVVVSGRPDEPGQPLLAQRPLLDGGPAAYVCHGFVCDRPVGTVAELAGAALELRAFGAQLVDLGHGVAQVGQPFLGVLADQA